MTMMESEGAIHEPEAPPSSSPFVKNSGAISASATAAPAGEGRGGGKSGVAADASFLETVDQTSSVIDLHRSNLLRLQSDELWQECQLGGSSSSSSSWTSRVAPYVEQVSSIIAHKVLLSDMTSSTINSCPFVLSNNKPKEHLEAWLSSSFENQPQQTGQPSLKTLPFLPLPTPVLSTADHILGRGNCALTKATGNAKVLPTFALVVQIPSRCFQSKDYLKHKYFDKRSLIVWHVARTLHRYSSSNNGSHNNIGRVYWTYEHNDVRKPTLFLIPPDTTTITAAINNKTSSNKKRKQNTHSSTAINNRKSSLPKFRIQLQFEMESLDWIPPLRLLPNRCNVPIHDNNNDNNNQNNDDNNSNSDVGIIGSPIYNHALLEDWYHQFLPTSHREKQLLSLNNGTRGTSYMDDDDQNSDNDNGTLIMEHDDEHYPHWLETTGLVKIWCLQRGLLRNHDGFTTDHLALLILYLYRTKQANARMAPLQVLAVLFKILSETHFAGEQEEVMKQKQKDGKEHPGVQHVSDNKNNLLRATPSEAFYYNSNNSNSNNKQKNNRAVWVLPLPGRTEAQTIATSKLAKLYAQQTAESPLTPNDPQTLLELYRTVFPGPVFLDSTMKYNYWGRLSPNFIALVQMHARKSLACLHSPSMPSSSASDESTAMVAEKPFEALFMKPARFWDAFDLYLNIPLKDIDVRNKQRTKILNRTLHGNLAAADWGEFEAIARSIVSVLKVALGDRIRSMRILSTGNGLLHDQVLSALSSSSNHQHHHHHHDTDQIPLFTVEKEGSASKAKKALQSPTGTDSIVLGISLDSDTCHRIVDRGPPSEDTEAIQSFVDLWGDKSELRRFKDGAIVQAVVWNSTKNEPLNSTRVRYENEDSLQGGIVERIIRYILNRHFLLDSKKRETNILVQSSLRDISSLIDGVAMDSSADNAIAAEEESWFRSPTSAHRNIMKAYEALASFLKTNSLPTLPVAGTLEQKTSRLGIPLAIDAIEPLSPSLRYSELYPALPHPFVGNAVIKGMKKVSGVITSEPVCIQIRFGASSKWPTDLKAIGAAKAAMLIQLANGIEEMRKHRRSECDGFEGVLIATPTYLDVGYKGYVFRIKVRADPEIRLLRGLFKPSNEAADLLRSLTREHIISAMHHSVIHSIHTMHATSSAVVRLAKRWVSGHLLSGLIPNEAIELLVAKVYADRNSPVDAPGTVTTGFLRFLYLLESHDWIREPLIVDPHGHIEDSDRSAILSRFEQARGPTGDGGPPMYIISPYDRQGLSDSLDTSVEDTDNSPNQQFRSSVIQSMAWTPGFTSKIPEWVVLTRVVALAKKARTFLMQKRTSFDSDGWSAAFQETSTSFKAYSALLRISPEFLFDDKSSSTGDDLSPCQIPNGTVMSAFSQSMRGRYLGPKPLRLKMYKNMRDLHSQNHAVLHDWRPVDEVVQMLRRKFDHLALFFYNALCPDVIAVLFRPNIFVSKPFSVMSSEYAQPCLANNWNMDTMVMLNGNDFLREMSQYYSDVVSKVKVLQTLPAPEKAKSAFRRKRGKETSDWVDDEIEVDKDDDEEEDSSSDES